MGFPGGASGKEPGCQCRRHKRGGFDPWVRKIPWMKAWQPTPVFLPGESHRQRSLENPMDREACWATVHGIANSWILPKQFSTHTCKWTLLDCHSAKILKII